MNTGKLRLCKASWTGHCIPVNLWGRYLSCWSWCCWWWLSLLFFNSVANMGLMRTNLRVCWMTWMSIEHPVPCSRGQIWWWGYKDFWNVLKYDSHLAKVNDCEKFSKGQKVIILIRVTSGILSSSQQNSGCHQPVLKFLGSKLVGLIL